MLESVTLDQLRMLVAIVDTGSFTAAAKKVQRGQSAVSQAIANLEFQLDLKLFDRSTKRPRLTDAGATIVGDARAVIDRSDALKAKARALSGGLEAQVSLAVSMLAPIDGIADTLQAFGESLSPASRSTSSSRRPADRWTWSSMERPISASSVPST